MPIDLSASSYNNQNKNIYLYIYVKIINTDINIYELLIIYVK